MRMGKIWNCGRILLALLSTLAVNKDIGNENAGASFLKCGVLENIII